MDIQHGLCPSHTCNMGSASSTQILLALPTLHIEIIRLGPSICMPMTLPSPHKHTMGTVSTHKPMALPCKTYTSCTLLPSFICAMGYGPLCHLLYPLHKYTMIAVAFHKKLIAMPLPPMHTIRFVPWLLNTMHFIPHSPYPPLAPLHDALDKQSS